MPMKSFKTTPQEPEYEDYVEVSKERTAEVFDTLHDSMQGKDFTNHEMLSGLFSLIGFILYASAQELTKEQVWMFQRHIVMNLDIALKEIVKQMYEDDDD